MTPLQHWDYESRDVKCEAHHSTKIIYQFTGIVEVVDDIVLKVQTSICSYWQLLTSSNTLMTGPNSHSCLLQTDVCMAHHGTSSRLSTFSFFLPSVLRMKRNKQRQ